MVNIVLITNHFQLRTCHKIRIVFIRTKGTVLVFKIQILFFLADQYIRINLFVNVYTAFTTTYII